MPPQLSKKKKGPVTRASNARGSDVGKRRSDLYANAYRKIAEARAAGFYIECIAILESIICDRLESRRACLNPNDTSKHRFETLRTASKLIAEESSHDADIRRIYQDILDWSNRRNEAVHQIVKLASKDHTTSWARRYGALRRTVDRGEELARAISRKVEALNKHDHEQLANPKTPS